MFPARCFKYWFYVTNLKRFSFVVFNVYLFCNDGVRVRESVFLIYAKSKSPLLQFSKMKLLFGWLLVLFNEWIIEFLDESPWLWLNNIFDILLNAYLDSFNLVSFCKEWKKMWSSHEFWVLKVNFVVQKKHF